MYSADLSLFVLDAGIRLLEQDFPPALLYLLLTDYIQLKYPPDHAEALAYYAALDQRCARLEQLGAIVALVGDHGMTDKCAADGSYNIIYLQDLLDAGGECEVAAADVSVAAGCAALVDACRAHAGGEPQEHVPDVQARGAGDAGGRRGHHRQHLRDQCHSDAARAIAGVWGVEGRLHRADTRDRGGVRGARHSAPIKEALFRRPRHPYTATLLAAVPNPDPDIPPQQVRLSGEVADLANLPAGCAFPPGALM